MGTFMIGFVVGWIVGMVMTCFVLAKKNLEKMQKAESIVEDKTKEAISVAKATYNYYSKTPEERTAEETVAQETEEDDVSKA